MTGRPDTAALLAEVRSAGSEIDAVLAEAEAAGVLAPVQPVDMQQPGAAQAERAPQAVQLVRQPGDGPKDPLARASTAPFVPAAVAIVTFAKKGLMAGEDVPINTVVDQLEAQASKANAADLTHAEAVLAVQATTLDAVFNAMALKAAAAVDKYPDAGERFLRMALKAQAQCRATIETLAAIKNGPVVFARQANINNGGQQQVNNGGGAPSPAPRTRARSKGKASRSNELLEGGHGQRMDP